MIEGAIFDLDGTLLDSMSVWETVADDYLRSLGKQPEKNLKERLKTFGLEQSAMYFKERYGVALSVGEIVKGIERLTEKFYLCEALLKNGAAEFLAALGKAGVKMCVATATSFRLAASALERCKVSGLFSGVITQAQAGSGKESPEIYRKALKLLGTDKKKTLVFEDALYAIKTAKKDGFPVAAVFDVYEENQSAVKKISDFYIRDFSRADVGGLLELTI